MTSTFAVGADPRRRISAEFLEMPGLCLTLTQASRLFGLEQTECSVVLKSLIEEGFLTRTRDGLYSRPGLNDRAQTLWSQRL